MAKADLWHARLAVKTLRKDQRQAIAEAGESRHGRCHLPFPGGGLAGAVVPTPATLLKFALEDREEGHSKSQAETLLCSHADHEAFC